MKLLSIVPNDSLFSESSVFVLGECDVWESVLLHSGSWPDLRNRRSSCMLIKKDCIQSTDDSNSLVLRKSTTLHSSRTFGRLPAGTTIVNVPERPLSCLDKYERDRELTSGGPTEIGQVNYPTSYSVESPRKRNAKNG